MNSSAPTVVLNVTLVAQMQMNSIVSLANNNIMPAAQMQTNSIVPPADQNEFNSSIGGSQCYTLVQMNSSVPAADHNVCQLRRCKKIR